MRREEDRLIKASPLIALAAVLALVPAAAAASGTFGAPEPVDSGHWLNEQSAPGRVLTADGAGRALLLSVADGEQLIAYERCGAGWGAAQPIGPAADDIFPEGLAETPNGTAMAIWRAQDTGGSDSFFSSVRASGAPGALRSRSPT